MRNYAITVDLDAGAEVERGQVIFEDTGVFKLSATGASGANTQVLIANTDGEAGHPVGGVIQGPQHIKVGYAAKKYDLLMPGAGGKAVEFVATAGNVAIGRALEDGADGDLVFAFVDCVSPHVEPA